MVGVTNARARAFVSFLGLGGAAFAIVAVDNPHR
jgi:hypothetical protein